MARYIDADKLCKGLKEMAIVLAPFKQSTILGVVETIKNMPTADVVAVVRCKDCKHKVVTRDGEYNPEDIVCDYHMSDGFDSNDFCSYGERKE